ncbi:MAG: DUF4957 domain-containing protein [Bacteroidales bacterium]|nr:DUF4957 domain-containing protein [Bacteroidales bacterium]
MNDKQKVMMIMKTKHILKGIVFALFLTFLNSSCTRYDVDLIEELAVDREFAPVALTARVRNQTIVELNWTVDENVDHYLVEFSADDPNFTTIFTSAEVKAAHLPVQIALEGETVYAIRVKAVSARGLADSKWAIAEATTLTEQLMLASQPGDILALEATFRWVPNINVTQILINPGEITHDITAQEKIYGVATVTGLISETEYTAQLLNGTKVRGTSTFTTGIDIGDNTLVTVDDDLFQLIADAADGDILLLEAGDYTAQVGTITLDKSLTIQGLRSYNKPLLKVSFSIVTGAADVGIIDLDLTGDLPLLLTDVVRYTATGNFNSLLVSGCNIHDYDRSFIAGNVTDAIVQSVTVENCIVTNVLTNGGDFIDFRNSDALNVSVTTSTFNNCAPARDFIRLDAAGTSNNTGLTLNVLLENCTIYGCSNTADRIFYVRFASNAVTARNNLFAETTAYYSNQSTTDPVAVFFNNNYFNAPTFFDSTQKLYDATDTYTDLDPGFVNAAAGDFTVTNQTLLDNEVGDPRWRL